MADGSYGGGSQFFSMWVVSTCRANPALRHDAGPSWASLRHGDVVEVDVVGAAARVVTHLEASDGIGAEVLAGQAQAGNRCAVQRDIGAAGTAIDGHVQHNLVPAAGRHACRAGRRDT